MTIDLHTHILPESWPDLEARYGEKGFVRLEPCGRGRARLVKDGRVFREVESNCWDAARRISECDAAGVDLQVLSTVPVLFCYWAKPAHALDLSRLLNDHVAGVVAAAPARFAGLGTLPLQDPDLALRELERCMGELGLCGVQLGSHVGDWNLDEPRLLPVFRAAERLGAAVFIHPWDMLAPERMPRYFLPWLVGMPAETALAATSLLFGGVLDRCPRLRIGLAHGGGAFPFLLGRIDHAFDARPDLCAVNGIRRPRAYARRFYYDTLVHDPEALRFLLKTVGADRLALGTDYPFPLGEREPGCLIRALKLPKPQRERLLGGTAAEFLGLKAGGRKARR